jgi:hypothetical protein
MPEDTPKIPFWQRSRPAKGRSPLVQVRFTADSGEVWTVWDTTFSNFKHHRRAHCDSSARARVFVNAAGVKRSYTFKRGESRVLDAEALERQLREAAIVGKMRDQSDRTPW